MYSRISSFLFAILLSSSSLMFAQIDWEGLLGMNYACLTGDSSSTLEAIFCPAASVSMKIIESGNMDFSGGISYIGSGVKDVYSYEEEGFGDEFRTTQTTAFSIENQVSLAYIQLPLNATYRFSGDRFKPFVSGGTILGLLLKATATSTTDFNGDVTETEEDAKDLFNTTNLGIQLGGGFEFPLGSFSGIFGIRYGIGLTNISAVDGADSKTRDLSFQIGIRG